jgi:hypothetical protein
LDEIEGLFPVIENNSERKEVSVLKPEKEISFLDHKKDRIIRDRFFEHFSIKNILNFLTRNNGDLSFKIENNRVVFESKNPFLELPDGYGYKGGAARAVLRTALGLNIISPRDIDLIRLSDEAYPGADEELAQKYMGADFEFGDGVECLESVDEYFNSRDFTCNEVLVLKDKIIVSEACVRDTLRNIIRVSCYEKNAWNNTLGPKVMAKALRFYVQHISDFGYAELASDDRSCIERAFINPFWIAVHLDRAFEVSNEVAEKFLEILKRFEIVDVSISTPEELIIYLMNEIDGDFYFRNAPQTQYDLESESIHSTMSPTDIFEDFCDKKYFGHTY